MLAFAGRRYAVVAQTLAGWEHHQAVKITGSEGALWASWSGALDRTFHPTFWLKAMRGDQVEEVPIEKMTGEVYELVDEIENFVRSVRGDSKPVASGEDGRWSVAMCLKAQESVDTGYPVRFA
jgi:myo-inositol 2-dehydrogenase/D-chiro-inositol 1-dehydrogenase